MLALAALTIPVGLWIESRFPGWGPGAVSVWTWTVYLAIIQRSARRAPLVLCVVFATLGELFLSAASGFYTYREGHVPFFVPPGHVLIYWLAGQVVPRIDRRVAFLPLLLSPVALARCAAGDVHGAFWFAVFLGFFVFSRERALYAIMFAAGLGLELLGTSLGTWTWRATDPWMGLPGFNPPFGAGVFYCVLHRLVLWASPRSEAAAFSGACPRATVSGSEGPAARIPVLS